MVLFCDYLGVSGCYCLTVVSFGFGGLVIVAIAVCVVLAFCWVVVFVVYYG